MSDLITVMAGAAGAGGAAETDEYFNQTTLLLHGDGTNGAQNNTFLDSSSNTFTITRNGNTTQGSFSPFSNAEGEWSGYFNSSASTTQLSLAGSSDFDQNGNFTIECWFYPTSASTNQHIWYALKNGSAALMYQTSKKFEIDVPYVGVQVSSTNTFELNAWYHVAAVRNGATTTLYVNGVSEGTTNYNFVANGGTNIDYICYDLNAYVSNLRFVKSAVYTSAFTPPTAPLTAIANTSVLMLQSNRFVDNNTPPKTITILAGTPSVQPFSPFAPSAAYSPSVNGGSGYFDGTGDYLSVGSASDWTFLHDGSSWSLQFWMYNSGTAQDTILATETTSSYNGAWVSINLITTNAVTYRIYHGVGGEFATFTSNAALVQNAWNYVVITFDTTTKTASFYINGSAEGSTANTGWSYSATAPLNPLLIGTNPANNYPFTGYLSNIKISDVVIGSPTNIPTAPLTSDANTVLLTNFTNAGIFDNTGKNNLETVADAQIDTTTKKYGTGSMEFDGTGDYIRNAPQNVAMQSVNAFGTGDFTIECWIYLTTLNAANHWYSSRGGAENITTGFSWGSNSSGGLYIYTNGQSLNTASSVISTNTWFHVAFCRASGTAYMFVDGTQVSTGSFTNDLTRTSFGIGGNPSGDELCTGFIDDVRITKGVARYTSNFTPPTKAFPDQ